MNEQPLTIEIAKWPQDSATIKDLRRKVFVIEQGVEPEIEWDGRDHTCTHVLARLDGEPVGTGRIMPSGHIGRLAVLNNHRGKKIGKALLEHLIQIARQQQHEMVYLNSQVQAIGFYEQYGFIVEGKVFMVAGIPHQRMEMKLSYDDRNNILEQEQLNGIEENYSALLELAYLARYSIDIFTPDLDRRLLSRNSFIQTLKGFIKISPKSRIRVLVTDPTMAIRYDHLLIELSQEFSSFIQIKKTHREYAHLPYSYILIDSKASLYRPLADEYEAKLDVENGKEARLLQAEFDEIWNVSELVPGIKRLFI